MKRLFLALFFWTFFGTFCKADQLVWQTPFGTVGLPFTATNALIGYDAILKQAIGGASVPVYTDPKAIVSVNLGAVAPWPVGNQSTIQPYISASHNILKEIPTLNQFQSLGVNIFGRYDPALGKAGMGISFSYAFVQ